MPTRRNINRRINGTVRDLRREMALRDRLQQERDVRLRDQIDANRREMVLRAELGAEADKRRQAELDARLASVNEFRAQMGDQAKSFASSEKVDLLTQRMDRSEGKSGGLTAGWGYLLSAVAALGTLAGVVGVLYAVLHGKP